MSSLRGSIWLEAGDAGTAALFYEHAFKLQPENSNCLAMFLYALNIDDPAKAQIRADEILLEHEQYSPAVVSRAADIKFMSARTTSGPEANRVFDFLEPILKNTVARFDQQDSSTIERSCYLTALALLGVSYEFQGRGQSALELYSRGLQLDPDNDALLLARGILMYGTSPRAITDFELAIRAGTTLIWPYVFLAHHYLVNGRFDECRKLCERALSMNGSSAVMSEVSEWLAIAQAELGFPAEMIRASFDNAIRLDPSNERAKRNVAAFEAANGPIVVDTWETRSAAEVQTSGRIERRFNTAA